jgi:hypothetical protein
MERKHYALLDTALRIRPDSMKVSLILAHPREGSFNHAIAEMARNTLQSCGHQVIFHDLYKRDSIPFCVMRRFPKTLP